MKPLLSFCMISLLLAGFLVSTVNAQEESRKVERITIPYTAANADRRDPEHYSFPSGHVQGWILTIKNDLLYNPENPDAKVVLRLMEEPLSDTYPEIAMFGAPSRTFWFAIANEEVGYMRIFQQENSWLEDTEVRVTYIQNDRISVNNGQRNVMDRLSIGPLVLKTMEVYGKDASDALENAFGGEIVLDVISGNPLENPVMMMPIVMVAVAAGAVIALLKIKKRT